MKLMKWGAIVLAGMSAVAAPLAVAAAPPRPQYHTTRLDPGSDADYCDNAAGISDNGLAVGQVYSPRRAAVWDVTTRPSTADPMWVDTLACPDCLSSMGAISADGSWIAGSVCDEAPCGGLAAMTLMIWERTGSTFVRTAVDEDPVSRYVDVLGLSVVGGLRTVIKGSGLWREVAPGTWQLENRVLGGTEYRSINSAGTVCAQTTTPTGQAYRARVLDCLTSPCGQPVDLPGQTGDFDYDPLHINEVGDIVGSRRTRGSSVDAALIWPRSGSNWDVPVILPVTNKLSNCYPLASNYVDSVLTVVGRCQFSSGAVAVRWRKLPPGWTPPDKIEALDDSGLGLRQAVAINGSGQIVGSTDSFDRLYVASPNP